MVIVRLRCTSAGQIAHGRRDALTAAAAAPAVAKAAKAVGGRVKLQAGEDEDAEDLEESDDNREAARLWGANKRAYHGADDEVTVAPAPVVAEQPPLKLYLFEE